jgi:hypothetical protein
MTQMIFLTSLPRSGSTWASQAITSATRSRFINEPFNWKRYTEREKFHMRYLPAGSMQPDLIEIIKNTSNLRIPIFHNRLENQSVVIKDVHICLAIEYIWEQLRPHTIILIRHPCGMANSWVKLNYEVRFRIDLLLSQDNLVVEHLAPFESHLNRKEDTWFDIGVYWGASHFVLDRLSAQHPEWQWITHEDLCIDAKANYEKLLLNLGVDVTESGQKKLDTFLNRNIRISELSKPYSVARISENEPDKWRTSLTTEQIRSVLLGAEPFGILEKYYTNLL